MDYSKANTAAWEEAFAKHRAGYKEDPALRLRRGDRSFLEADVIVELEKIGLAACRREITLVDSPNFSAMRSDS